MRTLTLNELFNLAHFSMFQPLSLGSSAPDVIKLGEINYVAAPALNVTGNVPVAVLSKTQNIDWPLVRGLAITAAVILAISYLAHLKKVRKEKAAVNLLEEKALS